MAYSKYRRAARGLARRGRRAFRKRYVSKRGNYRVAKLARDIRFVKSQLNVEHKYIDNDIQTFFGSSTGFSNAYPYVQRLVMPRAGTANNERIGNEIKVSHISYRLDCDATVFSASTIDRLNIKVSLLVAWNPDDATENDVASTGPPAANNILAESMFIPTIAGSSNYPPSAYTNKPNYKKWIRLASKTLSVSDLMQIVPTGATSHSRNLHINGAFKCNFKPQFEVGGTTLDVCQPFIMFQTDSPGNSLSVGGVSNEPQWKVVGKVRMTYIDN